MHPDTTCVFDAEARTYTYLHPDGPTASGSWVEWRDPQGRVVREIRGGDVHHPESWVRLVVGGAAWVVYGGACPRTGPVRIAMPWSLPLEPRVLLEAYQAYQAISHHGRGFATHGLFEALVLGAMDADNYSKNLSINR